MDCCNYVQPYTGAGHFYQQHHFCYDNMNAHAAYAAAPVSNAVEVNARYNRLPPAYPTDYVYNPKEARLRKAMREQSRELSRQSILQTAIATAAGNATSPGVNGIDMSGSNNFGNHPAACASPAASSLPGSPSVNPSRIINPWFSVGPPASAGHLKPALSPRVMAAHQRTLDKSKEALRKQVECAAAARSYPGNSMPSYSDFPGHGGSSGVGPGPGQGNNEYCIIAEFSEGQKWHPYQNGAGAYHQRGSPMAKIGGLHPNMQGTNPHGPWGPFCGVPLSNSSGQGTLIRGPRHMVFLQEHQNQHCNFNEELQLPYGPSKVEISHRLHAAYPQEEHQLPADCQTREVCKSDSGRPESRMRSEQRPLQEGWYLPQQAKGPSVPTLPQIPHLQQESNKCPEEGPRWEPPDGPSVTGADPGVPGLISGPKRELELPQDQDQGRELCQESQYVERVELKQKMSCKQPLPGFHQAFGSTEIGRFSRSEFFANMVGDSGNVSISRSCNGQSNGDPNGGGNYSLTYYNEVRSPGAPTPRWHSPYVSAVGSEI
ncbi:uncharacterized protein LOC105702537 [Orussus abietinus]|uniref:uncharacterized protein LOC105702537 n=1 Tax=Orussus abietinus TaxID=222816 RepID=UPI000C715CF5|nr:uncharacterized protein LOC105702537 [Orussus abietinus]